MADRQKLMSSAPGFIAALDQSGGSTPKTLAAYGVKSDRWTSEEGMFVLVHEMRTRIMKNSAFRRPQILGTILFQSTLDRKLDGQFSSQYLWRRKGILPFLKIDQGLADMDEGVQLMKPFTSLFERCAAALELDTFGTKMRSVIKQASESGIRRVVEQQFEYAEKIYSYGLVPIIEPEIDINSTEKSICEAILRSELVRALGRSSTKLRLVFKLTLPEEPNFYRGLGKNRRVLRVAALSGGYSQVEANDRLAANHGMIASFSRALTEPLREQQSEEQFSDNLSSTITRIADSSAS